MNTVAIDVFQRSRNAALSKQVHKSMDSFWVVFVKVPKHGIIWHVCLRVSFMTPVHGWKLDGIPNKEDGQVIENKVLDTLLCVKLCCPTSNISNGVTGPFFAANG